MTRHASIACSLLMAFASSDPALAETTPEPTRLRLAFHADGAGLSLGTGPLGRAPSLPAGGDVDLGLGACDESGTCEITGPLALGTFGDLLPPIPLAVANVPVCIRVRPHRAVGTTSVATGAVHLAIPSTVDLYVTEIASPCPTCNAGTCAGGAFDGAPCAGEAQVAIPDPSAPGSARIVTVSRDCPPADDLASSIPVALTLTTAQLEDDLPCDLSSATGATVVPEPPFPDPTLPKHADVTLAGGGCFGSSGTVTLDAVYGLPGPLALRLPARATWDVDTDVEDAHAITVGAARRRVRVHCRSPRGVSRPSAVCEAFGTIRTSSGTEVVGTRIVRRSLAHGLRAAFALVPNAASRGILHDQRHVSVTVYGRIRERGDERLSRLGTVTLDR